MNESSPPCDVVFGLMNRFEAFFKSLFKSIHIASLLKDKKGTVVTPARKAKVCVCGNPSAVRHCTLMCYGGKTAPCTTSSSYVMFENAGGLPSVLVVSLDFPLETGGVASLAKA